MSSTRGIQHFLRDARGIATIFSILIAIASASLALLLAVTNPDSTIFFAGIYDLKTENDYNVVLVILEVLFAWIIFTYLSIGFANRKEYYGQRPDWLEIFMPAVITLLGSALIVNSTYTLSQEVGGSNFTRNMKWSIFGGNVGMIILTVIYFFLSTDKEE